MNNSNTIAVEINTAVSIIYGHLSVVCRATSVEEAFFSYGKAVAVEELIQWQRDETDIAAMSVGFKVACRGGSHEDAKALGFLLRHVSNGDKSLYQEARLLFPVTSREASELVELLDKWAETKPNHDND